ncbi:acyl-CoA thioesterase [Micromonospora chalcea]|uniref:acyl-CoA thioesterase n=1 Tax=Micromonospora chalcea TaxID=1874 RepID=UPI00332AED1D
MTDGVAPLLARLGLRVPMRDVDQAGVIYYPAPLAWHEQLYTGWLDAIGHPLSGLLRAGEATATVSANADYLAPVSLDDRVDLELRSGPVGRSSFTLCSVGFRRPDRREAVRVRTVHVWSRLDGGRLRAAPMPDWLREALSGGVVADAG